MMKTESNHQQMAATIEQLRETTEALQKMAPSLPAVEKNTHRILASIKMLELNISDACDVELLATTNDY